MEYFLSAVAGVVLTTALTPLVRQYSLKNKIVDQPGGRRINQEPIPRMGGVAIVASFWLIVLVINIMWPDLLNLTGEKILGLDRNLFGVLLGSLVLVSAGVLDDIRGLSPLAKLGAQFLAAICIPPFGIHLQWLAHPLGGPDIQLTPLVDAILIVIWIVGLINVVNWLDGLDGLATGVSGIGALILFVLSLAVFVNQPATALLAIILFACCLGFIPFNFNPAKIFLGDSGSMFLGFMLAIFAVISGGKVATAGLVLGIPILDAAWVILRRLAAGQKPWQADRKHLHHRLFDAGLNQKQTVLLYWVFSGLFGIIALFSRTNGKTLSAAAMVGIMLIIGLILLMLDKKKAKL
jgi:UDP-GlcNAc:undecaprenyl-phosphate GlcNAc-1-phosphate transferase